MSESRLTPGALRARVVAARKRAQRATDAAITVRAKSWRCRRMAEGLQAVGGDAQEPPRPIFELPAEP
jgi:hypothetical protein